MHDRLRRGARATGARPPSASPLPRSRWRRPLRWSTRWPRSPRSSPSASSTCSPCCSSRPSGAAGSGVATALASALAFNFFHIPPTGRFTIAEGENWVALAVFFVAALVASTLAERPASRAREAEQRRQEADLAAELARLLLRGASLDAGAAAPPRSGSPPRSSCRSARDRAARRSPATSAASRLPLRDGEPPLGTLLVPAGLARRVLRAPARARRPGARGAPGRRARARGAAARGRRDARAAPHRRAQDRAAARRLARPALAADGDRHRRPARSARRRSTDAERARAGGRHRRRGRAARRAWSTSCSTCRGWRRGAAEPRAEWCRSRRSCGPPSTTSRRRRGRVRAARSTATCRCIRADAAQLERAFANLLENARALLGRPAGLGARARRRRRGSSCASSTAGPASRTPSRSGSSRPSTARPSDPTAAAARAWGWPSCAASSRPTAGASGSSRCPGQGATFVVELPVPEPARRPR